MLIVLISYYQTQFKRLKMHRMF